MGTKRRGEAPEGKLALDGREYVLAKKQAKALGISVAELVRRAILDTLPATGGGAWMRYAGLVELESGDSRSSQSIDEMVYGAKHRVLR